MGSLLTTDAPWSSQDRVHALIWEGILMKEEVRLYDIEKQLRLLDSNSLPKQRKRLLRARDLANGSIASAREQIEYARPSSSPLHTA